MENKEDPPKSVLKRRNSLGKGLNSVSFEVDLLQNKHIGHDKIILKHSDQITSLNKGVKSLEKDIIALRSSIDTLSTQISNILDG